MLAERAERMLADYQRCKGRKEYLEQAIPELEGDSNQHVSALMRGLVLAGTVEKYSEKRRTYFRVA